MKAQITQEKLAHALMLVGRVATTRAALPVLANVLIRANKNRIELVATNLDIAITHSVTGKVDEPGAITVPARLLADYVSSLPNNPVELALDGAKLNLKSGSYSSVMNGIAADEFPDLPQVGNGKTIKVGVTELKTGIAQTIMAASSDETRPVLTGAFVHTHEKQVFMVATDSYRLAQKRLVKQAGADFSLIIPASSLGDVMRIIGDASEGEVEVAYDETQVQFNFGDSQLITRQIDGSFPAYRQLIPDSSDVSLTIDRSEFLNITKVASLFARESAGSITLSASEDEQQVSITSVASQVGQNTSIASAKVKGSGQVTLNSRYLLDGLNAIDADQVNFRFSGKINPCVLTPAKGDDYLHIVMPLKS